MAGLSGHQSGHHVTTLHGIGGHAHSGFIGGVGG